jgi:anti-sigma-K factor RskA
MGLEGDRGKRAGNYILGLMGETDRERAERDLEIDPAFRDAVIRLADEMRLFDRAGDCGDAGERWKLIARRIAELPQMRQAGHPASSIIQPASTHGFGIHAWPGRRAVFVALGLIVAFVLGYVVGRL